MVLFDPLIFSILGVKIVIWRQISCPHAKRIATVWLFRIQTANAFKDKKI